MIERKIIQPGREQVEMVDGTKVKFHIKVENPETQEVIDDSRTWTDPMELLLGKKFKLEVLEAAVRTMHVGETSEFIFGKQLIRSYPFVAKTLRDYHAKKQGKPVQASGHHCCAGNIEQGLGYPDLDKLIATPQDLKFTIELLSADKPGSFEKEAWAMTEEEQKVSTDSLKEQGNIFFSQGKHKEAADKYSEAIGRLENLMLREKPGEDDWVELNKKKLILLLNFSQCKLLLKDYYPVIEHCSTVLEFQPDNTKALFRRAKAYSALLDFNEARQDLEKLKILDPTLTSMCQKMLNDLLKEEKIKIESDKTMYKKIFS